MKSQLKLSLLVVTVAIFALSSLVAGCGSWAANTSEGKCSVDRKWVPPQQDPQTGKWKDGYCEWEEGKRG